MDITSDVYHQFMQFTLEGKWESVIEIYKTDDKARWTDIGGGRGTALHVAAKNGLEDVVKDLIEELKRKDYIEEEELKRKDHIEEEVLIIRKDDTKKVLKLKNGRGDTPLHLAAYGGFKGICKLIIGEHGERKDLIEVKNESGETPLFLAALSWQKHAFAYLFNIVLQHPYPNLNVLSRDRDGDTILHIAIRRDFFDLAVIIIHHCSELHDTQNKNGMTPLKLLAKRPAAFKSGSYLAWWKKIIYHCMIIHKLNAERKLNQYLTEEDVLIDARDNKIRHNYLTCYPFILRFAGKPGVGASKSVSKNKGNEERPGTSEHNISMPLSSQKLGETSQSHVLPEKKSKQSLVLPSYAMCGQFVKDAYFSFLGFSGLSNIGKIKKKHIWSGQLLSALMLTPFDSYMGSGGPPGKDNDESNLYSIFQDEHDRKQQPQQASSNDKRESGLEGKIDRNETALLIAARNETALLIAARNGIIEIVKEVLSKIPSAIHEKTINNMNVFHVAVKNRQPLVVEALLKILREKNKIIIQRNLIQEVDNDDNTVLHLAADSLSRGKSWKILGTAMQMMWDIAWLQRIKKLVPEHFVFRRNIHEKTPWDLFKESHKDLVEKSTEWMKTTSESCSVVAALIAGVSFATVGGVPGGSDNGKPALQDRPAFEAFAISSLVGLFFSVTALIMFLSILTSRKEATDFRRSLPQKLLLGLTSLFLSIAAMFVSFCTGHFFVLNNKYRHYVFPLYIATCLPVTYYAVAQIPIYLDLLQVIYWKVLRPSDTGDDL